MSAYHVSQLEDGFRKTSAVDFSPIPFGSSCAQRPLTTIAQLILHIRNIRAVLGIIVTDGFYMAIVIMLVESCPLRREFRVDLTRIQSCAETGGLHPQLASHLQFGGSFLKSSRWILYLRVGPASPASPTVSNPRKSRWQHFERVYPRTLDAPSSASLNGTTALYPSNTRVQYHRFSQYIKLLIERTRVSTLWTPGAPVVRTLCLREQIYDISNLGLGWNVFPPQTSVDHIAHCTPEGRAGSLRCLHAY